MQSESADGPSLPSVSHRSGPVIVDPSVAGATYYRARHLSAHRLRVSSFIISRQKDHSPCPCWTTHPALVGPLTPPLLDHSPCPCWITHPALVGPLTPPLLDHSSCPCWITHPALVGSLTLPLLDHSPCPCWTTHPALIVLPVFPLQLSHVKEYAEIWMLLEKYPIMECMSSLILFLKEIPRFDKG